jgi:hypothetical protein
MDFSIFFQNYPNPFNVNTTIKFFVAKSSDVRITVYNILGAKIEDLMNERKEYGYHEVRFSPHNLSSGVYFYNLTTGSNTITKKMLLIK